MSYLLIGLASTHLSERERDWLARDEVGGVVLFKRNIVDLPQLRELIQAVRAADNQALVTVDQEGGRVQRIGQPCTLLPPLACLGRLYSRAPADALALARDHAGLMATEMRALDIDLSFAPVLDVDGASAVIGDRAFSADPEAVAALGLVYIEAMHAAGMVAVAKHFPGHGSVVADSHHAVAVDRRAWGDILAHDLEPFRRVLGQGLSAMMLAHVIYPQVCPQPVGYSAHWIQHILRQDWGFEGVLLSDDIGMRAAAEVGDCAARVRVSREAGCDFVLVCAADDTAAVMAAELPPAGADRRQQLRIMQQPLAWAELAVSDGRRAAQTRLKAVEEKNGTNHRY